MRDDGLGYSRVIVRTAVVIILALVWGGPLTAGTPEYGVKAAYLYNFLKFTEWPNNEALTSFTLCVYGKDPFGGFLDETVRGKQASGLPVLVRRLPGGDERVDGCQILFISSSERLETVLTMLHGRSILTVGESDGFAARGGMIGLVMDQSNVRLDINLAAIAAARLQVSSRLILVCRLVGPRK